MFDIGGRTIDGVIEAAFCSLEIEFEQNHSYFPVEIGIRFKGEYSPEEWSCEIADNFWHSLKHLCDRRTEEEGQQQTELGLHGIIDTLTSNPELLTSIQIQLNKALETSGETLVRIPTIPGHSEAM